HRKSETHALQPESRLLVLENSHAQVCKDRTAIWSRTRARKICIQEDSECQQADRHSTSARRNNNVNRKLATKPSAGCSANQMNQQVPRMRWQRCGGWRKNRLRCFALGMKRVRCSSF